MLDVLKEHPIYLTAMMRGKRKYPVDFLGIVIDFTIVLCRSGGL